MDQAKALTVAREYAAAVRNIMDTRAIFLYGSQANGTAGKDSDIDIAVIVDDLPGDYLKTMATLWKLTRSVAQEIEPVLLTAKDDASGFLSTVRHTGIAV